MALTDIGAGFYSSLGYTAMALTLPTTQSEWEAGTYVDLSKINTFPAVGNPANITNVPQFGQAISAQINGQSDAPTLEFVLNYGDATHTQLQGFAGDNVQRGWRIRIQNTSTDGNSDQADDFYVLGSVAAVIVTPGLQGNTATLTIATSTEYDGPFTPTTLP